jgi:uncharacterized protein (UPF0276 family)
VVASGALGGSAALAEDKPEKCYGEVKAGKNDCQTACSSCAGTSMVDNQKDLLATLPNLGWLEVYSETYFGQGGAPLAYLAALGEHYPLSLHGVGLSLGSTDPTTSQHLEKLKALIDRFEPGRLSEHLSWGSIDGRHFSDLLPLPYT